MKKFSMLIMMMVLFLMTGMASAQDTNGKKGELTVLVNGVEVKSGDNHMYQSKVYVSLEEFADLLGKSYKQEKGKVIFNGKEIQNIRIKAGNPTAHITELGKAAGAQKVSWDQANKEAYVLILPEGTVQLAPDPVPAMGEHWANPEEMPNGPIYGVHNGKLIFLEYMIAQEDFVNGKSFTNLNGMKGLPSPAVVQSDIEFVPHGHPGFEVPHYDMHTYFISDEEQHKIATTYLELKNNKGEKVGYAAFMQMGEQLMLKINAAGLTPGKHGFHIHQNPIANNDFSTAGGHFNPTGKQHGHSNPEGAHLGDMRNLVVEKNGEVDVTIMLEGLTLEKGKNNSVLGKSLIIHAGEDDEKTDPAGNSGDRIVGGNIPQ
jgi:Cu/Zn superoxide dismutase